MEWLGLQFVTELPDSGQVILDCTHNPLLVLVAYLVACAASFATLDMAERVAIVGVGQTKHAACREDVSIPGLLREAVLRALEDAELRFADIDGYRIGTSVSPGAAPLLFDEVNGGDAIDSDLSAPPQEDNHGDKIRNVLFLDGHVMTFEFDETFKPLNVFDSISGIMDSEGLIIMD